MHTGPAGTTLLVCQQYDDGVTTVTTDTLINIFGRCITSGGTDPWHPLWNKQDTPITNVPMTIAIATDVTDGTDKWTKIDAKIHAFDLMGYNELLFTVMTVLNTDANDALAKLLAKVI